MKKYVFTVIAAILVNSTYCQSLFSNGYSDGYKYGYCYNKSTGCIPPIPPISPIPRSNESSNSYRDGYNRGFLDGVNKQGSSSSSSYDGTEVYATPQNVPQLPSFHPNLQFYEKVLAKLEESPPPTNSSQPAYVFHSNVELAMINDTNVTKFYTEANSEFSMTYFKGEMYFHVFQYGHHSFSTGIITELKDRSKDPSLPYCTQKCFSFNWNYENSYNDKKGVAQVTLYKFVGSDGVSYVVDIVAGKDKIMLSGHKQ